MTTRVGPALLLILTATLARAEPQVTTSYSFYPISPANRHDIRNELSSKGPGAEGGRDYIGYTDWRIQLRFHSTEREGVCSVSSASVALVVKYTLPRLDDAYFYDWATENSFDRYYTALLQHERGHAESGHLAAQELEDSLRRLRSHSGCATLGQNVDASFRHIMAKYRQRDIDYDRRTDHGRSQGADLTLLP